MAECGGEKNPQPLTASFQIYLSLCFSDTGSCLNQDPPIFHSE